MAAEPTSIQLPPQKTRHPSGKGLSTGSRWQPIFTFPDGVNPFVIENGYNQEGRLPDGRSISQHNIDEYGFENPREEFLNSPAEVTPAQIASKWALVPTTVQAWARNNDWYDLRAANLAQRPADTGGVLVSESMAAKRLAWVDRRIEVAEQGIQKIEDMIAQGEYQAISPSGEVKTLPLTPAAILALGKALAIYTEIVNTAMGVPSSLSNQQIDVSSVAKIEKIEVVEPSRRNPFRPREYTIEAVVD